VLNINVFAPITNYGFQRGHIFRSIHGNIWVSGSITEKMPLEQSGMFVNRSRKRVFINGWCH